MPSMKLCLALVLVAATSTHVDAVELVNPLQVLERSRRAGIEFDQRMRRDAAEQKQREHEQKAQQEAQRKREREQKAEADAQRRRETRAAKAKAGASSSVAKVTPSQ